MNKRVAVVAFVAFVAALGSRVGSGAVLGGCVDGVTPDCQGDAGCSDVVDVDADAKSGDAGRDA